MLVVDNQTFPARKTKRRPLNDLRFYASTRRVSSILCRFLLKKDALITTLSGRIDGRLIRPVSSVRLALTEETGILGIIHVKRSSGPILGLDTIKRKSRPNLNSINTFS
ncbi:hypothetical protein EVAR_19440_1 [Eumeta japonica]|uniref:Uncharacterized protein n=1 Tax=Eumeta variegata TaxID=151549 RepID=A0A4C1TRM5_EUMVA|nr:hypothetical protein EVAR_19440_1 [Eumeta japonica]